MRILVTNDDGIESPFLQPLVAAMSAIAEVTTVAPNREFSWVSKSMSRFTAVSIEELAPDRFALGGTPSDCVNIALAHLCPERPDLVVSGINIGHNASLPTVLSSGTVGAATEGSIQGVPSIACSLQLVKADFEDLHDNKGQCPERLVENARQAAKVIARLAPEIAERADPYGVVHNFNFPSVDISTAEVRKTIPAPFRSKSLFERKGDEFHFNYQPLNDVSTDSLTDRAALDQGFISHSVVDFSKLTK